MTDPRPIAPAAVDPLAQRAIDRYLDDADRSLPGRIIGFHLVGSIALRAYRPGRSDIDFVAIVDGRADRDVLRRLRRLHIRSGVRTASAAARHRRPPGSGMCNGVFISVADISRPVTQITPIARQAGAAFERAQGGPDVSPVGWKILAEQAVSIRGPEPQRLDLVPEPERLRQWNLDELERYWRPWAATVQRVGGVRFRARPRAMTSWGVLGVARVHHTIATGEIVSKEHAGRHARAVSRTGWHRLIDDALGYRARPTRDDMGMGAPERAMLTVSFVEHMIADARRIAAEIGEEARPMGSGAGPAAAAGPAPV